MGYQHLEIEIHDGVGTLWLNRPDKRNAMSEDIWLDIPSAMADLDTDDSVRAVVLAGKGKSFCVGIDVGLLASLTPAGDSQADANKGLYSKIVTLQQTANSLANSPKPVIAAIHGYCLGGGMDLVTACDIRLASQDAVFSVRETKMGLVADTGSLQRLPQIVGTGTTAMLAYTGDDFDAEWASKHGLVDGIFEHQSALLAGANDLARRIASNSPLVTQGIKKVLSAGSAMTVEQALEFVAQWNSSFLISNDLLEAISAFMEKRDPDFTGT